MYPGRGSIPRQTDWLTVSRNVTQTQTQTQLKGIERVQLRDVSRTGRTWAREAEESPLLEAVAREQLLKTLRTGEDLVFAAVICSVKISGGAVITCSSESCQ
jgi:hypothetical protein